jgi:signal transduction histidine kinase
MNIITNAAQATAATQRPLSERQVAISTAFEEGIGVSWVVVRIRDNGIGMNEATRSAIFDPFFTTKGVGEGTGLGLSIVMGILKDHNAEIEVTSTPGEGSEFILRFPT